MGRKPKFVEEEIRKMAVKYRQGASSIELAKEFGGCSSTIRKHLKNFGCRIRLPGRELYSKRDIPGPSSNEYTAYVFGVLIGDASIRYRYNSGERGPPDAFRLGTSDAEFVSKFSKAIKSAFEIQVNDHSDKEKNPYVQVCSVDLGRAYDKFKWRKETWRVPEEFFNAPKEIRIALCQGKFDSDGTVDRKAISLRCIHKQGLKDLQKVVESLSYKTTLNGPYKDGEKDTYCLRVCNASPELFRLPRQKKKLQKNRVD